MPLENRLQAAGQSGTQKGTSPCLFVALGMCNCHTLHRCACALDYMAGRPSTPVYASTFVCAPSSGIVRMTSQLWFVLSDIGSQLAPLAESGAVAWRFHPPPRQAYKSQ